jgi:hypothetical protein
MQAQAEGLEGQGVDAEHGRRDGRNGCRRNRPPRRSFSSYIHRGRRERSGVDRRRSLCTTLGVDQATYSIISYTP